VAGEIWTSLEGHNKVDHIDNLISELSRDRDLVLMSLGWLAREGHVAMKGDAPNYLVTLMNEKGSKDERNC
ncbi:MAG: winged helix-turn-helix domain-containing protein, partial [Candidatus Omnitrophota bacterium]